MTQVYQARLKTDLVDLKQEIFQIQKVDVAGQKWSRLNYKNGYTSYGSLDKLNRLSSSFLFLETKINSHVFKFAKSLDYPLNKNNLKLNTMWVNIMPSGAFHTSHIHPQSVFSGTYYIDTPDGASALKFEDPRLSQFMNSPQPRLKARKSNLRFFSLQPKAGDVVLFESWLKHEVPQNQSKRPRISISFNYGWA